MAPTRPCCCARHAAARSCASRCRRPAPTRTSRWVHTSLSASIRSGRSALPRPLPMPEEAVTAGGYRRLLTGLLLAPAFLWLFGLIVLPHLDLALLSLR